MTATRVPITLMKASFTTPCGGVGFGLGWVVVRVVVVGLGCVVVDGWVACVSVAWPVEESPELLDVAPVELDDFTVDVPVVVVEAVVVVVEAVVVVEEVEEVVVVEVGVVVLIDVVVEDVDGSVFVVVESGSVGSVVQSRVIGHSDGRDCALDENTSEAAPYPTTAMLATVPSTASRFWNRRRGTRLTVRRPLFI